MAMYGQSLAQQTYLKLCQTVNHKTYLHKSDFYHCQIWDHNTYSFPSKYEYQAEFQTSLKYFFWILIDESTIKVNN